MPKPRNQLSRILKRDGKCGVHIGGCGTVLTGRTANRDHMVSKSFIHARMTGTRHQDFMADWNVQPTCPDCNTKRGGLLDGWPLYKCQCHYLQIDGKGDLYVHETTRNNRMRRHLLDENVVHEVGYGLLKATVVTVGKMPPHGSKLAYSKGVAGHQMDFIRTPDVAFFNYFELVRVGIAKESMQIHDEQGVRYQFWPNGEMYARPDIGLPVVRFERENGHWNSRVIAGHEDALALAKMKGDQGAT